jgi:hypothetical protein
METQRRSGSVHPPSGATTKDYRFDIPTPALVAS